MSMGWCWRVAGLLVLVALGARIPLIILLSLIAYLLVASLACRYVKSALQFSLGFLVPLAPAAGPFALLWYALAVALLSPGCQSSLRILKPWLPWLLLLWLWAIATSWFEFDLPMLRQLWQLAGSWPAFLDLLRVSPLRCSDVVFAALRWTVMLWWVVQWQAAPACRQNFLSGLLAGVCLALPLTVLQGLQLLHLPNQSEFWSSIGRFVGTFSDPNSFGIFVALLVPVLWSVPQRGARLLALAWLAAAVLWSGSRSLYLGVLVLSLGALWAVKRKVALIIVALAVVALVVWNSLLLPYHSVLLTSGLPVGLTRLLESVSLRTLPDALFSRSAFGSLALEVWGQHPMFGVGLGAFRHWVAPYAESLGLGLHAWSDNPNNFYLGVAAELGLMGLLALLWGLASWRWRDGSTRTERLAVVVLAVLLIFGPHLDFDEVALLAAFSFASAVRLRTASTALTGDGFFVWHRSLGQALTAIAAVLVVIAVFIKSSGLPHGFYLWEMDESRQLVRWTARGARAIFVCDGGNELARFATVNVRAHASSLVSAPLRVKLLTQREELRELDIATSEKVALQLSCGALPWILVRLEVDRIWVPRLVGLGADSRALGVQVWGRAVAG